MQSRRLPTAIATSYLNLALKLCSFSPALIQLTCMRALKNQIITAYGEIGAIPGKMFDTFLEIFQSKNAPNPHDVPEAIAKLVGQSKGTRPARVVVGEPYGS